MSSFTRVPPIVTVSSSGSMVGCPTLGMEVSSWTLPARGAMVAAPLARDPGETGCGGPRRCVWGGGGRFLQTPQQGWAPYGRRHPS